jgi:hypothetical protein
LKPIIAIDPGVNGGIAVIDSDGVEFADPMPDGMTAIIDRLRDWRGELGINGVAVVENVGGYVPGNSGPAACSFARHVGNIEAALYCIGIPVERVAPATWQRALGTWPKDKQERKRAIKEAMARRYPHLSVTLKTADALGILTWYRQRTS